MTPVFVDTSALYALLVRGDDKHQAALETAAELRAARASLATSSFVVLETVALLQARVVGVAAVRTFYLDMLPLMEVVRIDSGLLDRAMRALLAASSRRISLTDWTSITLMQERGWPQAFAFDEDFARQGLDLVPR